MLMGCGLPKQIHAPRGNQHPQPVMLGDGLPTQQLHPQSRIYHRQIGHTLMHGLKVGFDGLGTAAHLKGHYHELLTRAFAAWAAPMGWKLAKGRSGRNLPHLVALGRIVLIPADFALQHCIIGEALVIAQIAALKAGAHSNTSRISRRRSAESAKSSAAAQAT